MSLPRKRTLSNSALFITASVVLELFMATATAARLVPVRQEDAPWHLARLSAIEAWPQDEPYYYDYYKATTKSVVTVYILDTGIDVNHPEFGGRAVQGANFYGRSAIDDNGRGTHLAGLVGSETFGVAKRVTLVAVKVTSGLGTGQQGDTADAIRWSRVNATDRGHSVICVPRSGQYSEHFNSVVSNTVQAGIPVIVAAGDNVGEDVSEHSPGSAELAYTVGASDFDDYYATLSNVGKNIRLFAPGVDIESTWFLPRSPEEGERETRVMSGTAQATALVCGLAAYFRSLDIGTQSPQALYNVLDQFAVGDILMGVPNGTLSKLAQNNFD